MPEPLDPAHYRELISVALAEDLGTGDLTTRATVPAEAMGHGRFVAKSPLVVAGLEIACEVFAAVMGDARAVGFADDPGADSPDDGSGGIFVETIDLEFKALRNDGDLCAPGDVIAEVRGRAATLLVAERTALNFLQYLSGIATLTRQYVDAAAGRVTILDTRKTTPGLRALAKYAVRCGGGSNHRAGLFDAVLIKDNHICVAGGIAAAVGKARAAQPGKTIEVEAQSLAEVDQAVAAGADVILLDNLSDDDTRVAIARIDRRAKVELSGNMTIERVRHLATFGADYISVGALTHSAPAADISFDIQT